MQRVREQVQVPEQLHSGAGRVKSVTVAVLDTGIAYHPDLVGRLLAFSDFVEGRSFPYDDNGHGTHVCGIVCGSGELSGGRFRGMAPEAKLVVGKVLDRQGEGSCDSMQEALEWVLRVKNRYGIRVLNISVGIGDLKERYKEQMLRKSLEFLWDHNILVVCAAGNTGPEDGSISEMASSRKVLTVGCHDGRYCKNDPGRCETYSGRGRRYDVTRKPDIVAPGTRILSCNAFWQNQNGRIYRPYVAKSGTSMATPIVSGAAALAMEKYPGIQIAGMYSPPFRTLTEEEDKAIIERINETKPDFVWVGLGAPKQEKWMAAHQGKIDGLMLGVGAGFDYYAENIKRAPMWMQKHNLEWVYRLVQDPKRLFKRYWSTNTKFIWSAMIKGK